MFFQTIIEISPFLTSLLINTYGDNYKRIIRSDFDEIQRQFENVSSGVGDTFKTEALFNYSKQKVGSSTNFCLLATIVVFIGKFGNTGSYRMVGISALMILFAIIFIRAIANRHFAGTSSDRYDTEGYIRIDTIGKPIAKADLVIAVMNLFPMFGIIILNFHVI